MAKTSAVLQEEINVKKETGMSEHFLRLTTLLRELFQLDQPDLDFGFYRIMHSKADEVTQFLDSDLLPQVKEAFKNYQNADEIALKEELKKASEAAKAAGFNPEEAPKVKEIKEKLAATGKLVNADQLEREVYDHLYSFFRRYYSEGDFLSKRVYKQGVYAIPYEGEEVKLHWANKDQYYIKTSEYLRDYTFKLRPEDDKNPMRVHFKLVDAEEGEHNNVKTAKEKERRFILAKDSPVEKIGEELVIRFEYRAPTEEDFEGNVPKQGDKIRTTLNAQAERTLLSLTDAKLADWVKELQKKHINASGEATERTKLAVHLDRYTARNTFDYFIHKDLGGFLRRELDFFIKNEILHLDDIESDTAPRVEQYLSKIKVIRKIAGKLIDFLAQLEDFQKKLWLKKKFVVETNYCITLDRIDEKFYPEIAKNEAQRKEWVDLFSLEDKPLTVPFLKKQPYLVLDTKFFDEAFKSEILAGLDGFDDIIDGCLLHSDNFQALSLLGNKYEEKIKCIHIDPPYNTQTSGFLYKNTYQHSSWLAMMEDRVEASSRLMHRTGSLQIHIDENEYERLHLLLEGMRLQNAGTVVWDKRNPMNGGAGIAPQHEYVTWHMKEIGALYFKNKNILSMLAKAEELITAHGGVTEEARKQYSAWVSSNNALSGGEKAYTYIDDKGKIFQSVSLRAPEPRTDPKFFQPLIHPVTKKPCAVPPNGFSRTPDTLQDMMDRGEILFGKDETTQPRQKVLLTADTQRQVSSLFQEGKKGKADLSPLGLDFPYCHPVSLYETLIGAVDVKQGEVVLDYFAGSGTTAHAVINLNREDGNKRKYLLIEAGEHFCTVLKPRIQKIIYGRKWADSKPCMLVEISSEYKKKLTQKKKELTELKGIEDRTEFAYISQKLKSEIEALDAALLEIDQWVNEGANDYGGDSHILKYVRLESYEDTLNNLQLRRSKAQKALFDLPEAKGADKLKEQYLLRYMMEKEAAGSASLLNVEAFSDPTAYKLNVKIPGSDESREVNVDLLETFNYLTGLWVDHIAAPVTFSAKFKQDKEGRWSLDGKLTPDDKGAFWFRRVEGVTRDGRKTLVIWRKLMGNPQQDNLALDHFMKDRLKINTRDFEFDMIYVNGDNNLENLRQADEKWKVRLIEEDFRNLMFDIGGI